MRDLRTATLLPSPRFEPTFGLLQISPDFVIGWCHLQGTPEKEDGFFCTSLQPSCDPPIIPILRNSRIQRRRSPELFFSIGKPALAHMDDSQIISRPVVISQSQGLTEMSFGFAQTALLQQCHSQAVMGLSLIHI